MILDFKFKAIKNKNGWFNGKYLFLGQFLSAFPQDVNNQIANPFGNNQSANAWPTSNGFPNNTNGFTNGFSNTSNGFNGNMNGLNGPQTGFINPFRDQLGKSNGLSNTFQPAFPSNGLTSTWGGNPFKVSFPNNYFSCFTVII